MHTVKDLDLRDARALVRVDFNVPLGEGGSVLDDARIRASLPTLRHLLDQDATCVLMTHLGRPGGRPVEELKLAPVAERLAQLLPEGKVLRCKEVAGPRAKKMADSLTRGQILVLENLRFHPGEKQDEVELAEELARLGEVYINDAFAVCHRRHASVHALAREFPPHERGIGLLVERELDALAAVVDSPRRPFLAVFGGAKVADKIPAVNALLGRVDRIVIGGAMAYTFLQARGREVGASRVEREQLDATREILDKAGDKILLPSDHVMARGDESGQTRIAGELSEDWIGLDIGPDTASQYSHEVLSAATVVWNGPLGKIEDEKFLAGTRQVAQAMASSSATTIVGGGETGEVARRLGLHDRLTHLSTGGGAFLDYIAHGTLPALEALRGG